MRHNYIAPRIGIHQIHAAQLICNSPYAVDTNGNSGTANAQTMAASRRSADWEEEE